MVRSQSWVFRAFALSVVAMLVAACGGTTPSTAPAGSGGPQATGPVATVDTSGAKAGGTIYILTANEQFARLDPQRAYTGEDLAFFSGTIYRSLTAYKYSADEKEGTSLTPDLATDLGKPTDGGKTWEFTLRDGVTFQDGSPITCDDIKYGVSRTFATGIITGGPTYAIQYLDIPTVEGFKKAKDGKITPTSGSAYGGPYSDKLLFYSDAAATTFVVNDKAAFDKSIDCAGNKITFHLNGPHADFNYTVTLGFIPVPKAKDTGESYGTATSLPVASGPYQVESYQTGVGGKMILVRNPNWKKDSDPYRPAYPDRWEVHFGIEENVLDQRLIASAGNDATAIQYGNVQPSNLSVVFADPQTANPDFVGRAISGFDPYSSYYWVNVNKIKNVKIRQAMAVALNREGLRLNIGGAFAGTFADGFVKPSIGADYAPTGLWDTFFGQKVPDAGDPELAKKLIADSGEAAPTLDYNFADSPTGQKNAALVIDSLAKAGITVKPKPLERGAYYNVVFDPEQAGDFGTNGWGADWPNASTVIPPLFTQVGGWDVSQVDDPTYNAEVTAALGELDRAKQATLWQALNKKAAENMYAIPTFFTLSQTIAGNKVAPAYRWAAYGSWPYGEMYVKQ